MACPGVPQARSDFGADPTLVLFDQVLNCTQHFIIRSVFRKQFLNAGQLLMEPEGRRCLFDVVEIWNSYRFLWSGLPSPRLGRACSIAFPILLSSERFSLSDRLEEDRTARAVSKVLLD